MRTSKQMFLSFDIDIISLQLFAEFSISSISISSSSVLTSLMEPVSNCDFSDSVSFTVCLANILNISSVIGSLDANASKMDSAATRTVGSKKKNLIVITII